MLHDTFLCCHTQTSSNTGTAMVGMSMICLLHGAYVALAGLTGMRKTGCSAKTRFVLHVPSSTPLESV